MKPPKNHFHIRLPVFLTLLIFSAAIFAQSNTEFKGRVETFLSRHNDYKKTIQLENDFHQALKTRNRKWIDEQAKLFKIVDVMYIRSLKEDASTEEKEFLVKFGSCEYASIYLYTAIISRAEKKFPEKLPVKLDRLIPQNLLDSYSENIRRCELVNGHPRTKRLIGE
jgi:hypothetical protein